MISDFTLHAADLGYRVTEPLVADGRIHRVNWKPDSGSGKPGWYVAFERGGDWSAVAWGDWRESWSEVWSSKTQRRMSQAERASLQAMATQAKEAEERERRKAGDSARRRANWIWRESGIEPDGHPYLKAKRISGQYLRIREFNHQSELLVPLCDAAGHLCNLQRILPDGSKWFVKNAGVTGLSWRCGPVPPPEWTGDIAVAEGMATAATVHQLSGATVFAAMNAGNLPSVVAWVRQKWSGARILIAADDDRWERDGTPRPAEKNTGRKAAIKAAEGTRALIILPSWTDLQSKGTDWNDLACKEGDGTAAAKWKNAVSIAALDRQVAVMGDAEYARRRGELQSAYAAAGGGKIGARELDKRRKGSQESAGAGGDGERPPQAVMIGICAEPEYWRDQFGQAFATFPLDGVMLNARVESQHFRDWLRMQFEDEVGTGAVPGREVVNGVIEQVAARARSRSPRMKSFYRMAYDGETGDHWLDLGRPEWDAIRWNADGWTLENAPAVKFVRGDGDGSLPVPLRNPELNGLEPLWRLINVHEEDRCLIAGWLLGAMMSNAPAFGLDLHGAQGTAKSTATMVLRRLIDPNPALTQTISERRIDDMPLTCVLQWIPCFENISWLKDEVQDVLCALTTGLAVKNRKLYSDGDIVAYAIRRPWIINGITNVCSRNDLAERAVPVGLLPIAPDQRRTEGDLEAEFQRLQPHLLAVLLDAAVEAVAGLSASRDWLAKEGLSHRMADAVQWITAGEQALGFMPGSFIRRLDQLQEEAGREAMEGNPVIAALEHLMSTNSRGFWSGTHEEILSAIEDFVPKGKWPKSVPHDSKGVGYWFKREAGRLRKSFGIVVSERKRSQKKRSRDWVRQVYRLENFQPTEPEIEEDDTDSDFM